jgi:hypothetical protein
MTVTKEELRILKKNTHVVLDKNGVDAWGVYVAHASKWHETRVFVAGKVVCKYSRAFGNARTTWKETTWPSTEHALEYASKVASTDSIIVGSPLLVQLTDADVALIQAGKMPAARYRGQARHEQIYGKVADTASWENAKTATLHPEIFNKVIAARMTASTSATPGIAAATVAASASSPAGSVPGPVGDEPF